MGVSLNTQANSTRRSQALGSNATETTEGLAFSYRGFPAAGARDLFWCT